MRLAFILIGGGIGLLACVGLYLITSRFGRRIRAGSMPEAQWQAALRRLYAVLSVGCVAFGAGIGAVLPLH